MRRALQPLVIRKTRNEEMRMGVNILCCSQPRGGVGDGDLLRAAWNTLVFLGPGEDPTEWFVLVTSGDWR